MEPKIVASLFRGDTIWGKIDMISTKNTSYWGYGIPGTCTLQARVILESAQGKKIPTQQVLGRTLSADH